MVPALRLDERSNMADRQRTVRANSDFAAPVFLGCALHDRQSFRSQSSAGLPVHPWGWGLAPGLDAAGRCSPFLDGRRLAMVERAHQTIHNMIVVQEIESKHDLAGGTWWCG